MPAKTERDKLRAALAAARDQLVAAFGIVRSHASDEHVQDYQRAMMMCDEILCACAYCGATGRDLSGSAPACQECISNMVEACRNCGLPLEER